jgi:hypothetical protein
MRCSLVPITDLRSRHGDKYFFLAGHQHWYGTKANISHTPRFFLVLCGRDCHLLITVRVNFISDRFVSDVSYHHLGSIVWTKASRHGMLSKMRCTATGLHAYDMIYIIILLTTPVKDNPQRKLPKGERDFWGICYFLFTTSLHSQRNPIGLVSLWHCVELRRVSTPVQ